MRDIIIWAFAASNALRIVAYLPQLFCIWKDTEGAKAISYTTWVLFAVSHGTAALYSATITYDKIMMLIFTSNTICCIGIVILTAWSRRQVTYGEFCEVVKRT